MIYQRHRRWLLVAAGAVLVAAAGTAGALAATGGGDSSGASGSGASGSGATHTVDTSGFPHGGRNAGIFTDRCALSHEAADDPILAPGKPGASMHHEFFGNTATSASSTAATLVGGRTTCTTSADASAYWTPVLYQDGKAVTPTSALIYWRQKAAGASAVHALPAGLTMIAGNEAATSPQSTSVLGWSCQGRHEHAGPRTGTPHSCTSGRHLKLTVFFPDCWDGHTLDGAEQTNVVYPGADGCPSSHPVEIPQVVFHTRYAISDARGLTLSMTPTMRGSTDTEHVDFMNGWDEGTLSSDVTSCIHAQTRCGPVSGSDATPHGPRTTARGHRRGDAATTRQRRGHSRRATAH